jgi:predicted Holliday junction resolvase-like endonuclease
VKITIIILLVLILLVLTGQMALNLWQMRIAIKGTEIVVDAAKETAERRLEEAQRELDISMELMEDRSKTKRLTVEESQQELERMIENAPMY